VSGATHVSWLLHGSWAKHLALPGHINTKSQRTMNIQLAEQTHQQYEDVYTMHQTTFENPPLIPYKQQDTVHRFDYQFDINGVAASDFEFTAEEQELFFLAGGPSNSIDNDELLCREIEQMVLQSVEDEFEGADDETVPNLADYFCAHGLLVSLLSAFFMLMTHFIDLEPEDVDNDKVYQHFTGISSDHDYAPYGNKTVHSPESPQCCSKLNMILIQIL
jgi:hypothetical protein